MKKPTQKPRSRRDIIERLKRDGPSDASVLAESMGVTPMAVRQHLYDLQAEGMVTAQEEPRAVGRPAKLWQLTPAADRYFPDAHADLAVGLIDALKDSLGQEALDLLIAERSKRQSAGYSAALTKASDLSKRLETLAEIRTREGYMAAVEPLPDAEGYIFIENHCPICSAAKACTGLCAMELTVFQIALGPDVHVERTDHILTGARRCAYRVTPC
ncbi:MAG: transcriptional regulator [Alphaproteobacteria bacterium]|nr:transcriptional regulator [Alphaproteobacteria bacterium]